MIGSKPIRIDVPGMVKRRSSSSARNLANKISLDGFEFGVAKSLAAPAV
jgi:hypothetical protein